MSCEPMHIVKKRDLDVRVPPHSMEAEQSVLGGLMLVPDALDKIMEILSEQDFYRRDHRLIYRGICELGAKGTPFDAVTLGSWFESTDSADLVGGAAYLAELANMTPSAANIVAYAEIVRDRSLKRQLVDAGTQIANESLNPASPSSQELVETAEQRIFHISELSASNRRDVVGLGEATREAFKVLTKRYENRGQLSGLATGWSDLDKLTAGLQPADLIIVAGRPSMGKTALALNIAEQTAVQERVPTLFFSMEMSKTQIAFRLLSSMGKIDQQYLRTGDMPEEAWPQVSDAVRRMTDGVPLLIDDAATLSPAELRSRARRVHREHKLGLIIVDYLQLMHVPGSQENRATEIAEITRSLKALAKELDVPVVALSQLNRSLEQRADKRPIMADLRESGAIEQDADLIMFIYRDEYYNKDSADKCLAEVIISKQRNGPTGTVKLAFRGQYTRFDGFSPDPAYTGYTE